MHNLQVYHPLLISPQLIIITTAFPSPAYFEIYYSELQIIFQKEKPAAAASHATEHYRRIGQYLAHTPDLQNLFEELTRLRDLGKPYHHFYLINGPSGIGKTQLPFALMARGLKVIYLLFTEGETRPKNINQDFKEISQLFLLALRLDLRQIDDSKLDSEYLLFSTTPLLTVVFLLHVLGAHSTSYTLKYLQTWVQDCSVKSDLPIFVLDEVFPPFTENKTRDIESLPEPALRLARNIFRAAGLVLLMMGTNSSAVNRATWASSSRCGSGPPPHWCRVIARLPKQTIDSISGLYATEAINQLRGGKYDSICEFFAEQFQTCLPWFVELIASQIVKPNSNELSATEFLDSLLITVASSVYDQKYFIHKDWRGVRGQLCMHLTAHKQGDITPGGDVHAYLGRNDSGDFVSHHFAHVDGGFINLFLKENGKVFEKNAYDPWSPKVSFPHATVDSFLYLLLGGGNTTFSPFGSGRSVFDAFLLVQNSCQSVLQGTVIGHSNPLSLRRGGHVYESLAAIATEIASHRGGVGGIKIEDFLFHLTCQLLPSRSQPQRWDSDSHRTCPQSFATERFPSSVQPMILGL